MLDFIISAILQLILFTFIPFVWWLLFYRKENFFEWIGLKKPILVGSLKKLCIVTLCVTVIYGLLTSITISTLLSDVPTATSQFEGTGVYAIPMILIYALIQTSLSEEILFRGFLCKRLIHRFGFVLGNSIQALIFGLMHGIPFFLATDRVLVLILLTLFPGLIGFYQGYLNEKKASGSIVVSWILHGFMNVISSIMAI